MNWINLLWLGLGVGIGIAIRGWGNDRSNTRQPQRTPETSFVTPPVPVEPSPERYNQPEQSIQELKQRLQQTELAYHMATEMSQFKGGFLHRTAHELRSPLNGIIGLHKLVLADLCDSPEEEREFIAQANGSITKMVDVLDSLIRTARMEHGAIQPDLQPAQLAMILQDVYDLNQLPAKDRNLRFSIQPADPSVHLFTDPQRLRQVLVYLVSASIQALSEGTIQVSSKVDPVANTALIWIEDNRPSHDRSDPIDYLQTQPEADFFPPSQGLSLTIAQIILNCMGARLDAIPAAEGSTDDAAPPTWLQVTVPLSP